MDNIDVQILSKIELFLSLLGLERTPTTLPITFRTELLSCNINTSGLGKEADVLLMLKIPCQNDLIYYRLVKNATAESNFGVVSHSYLVNNTITTTSILPAELSAEEWYRIFEYLKGYLLSFSRAQ